jgi:hypothetical protein
MKAELTVAPEKEVGIDLGLKSIAVTSDGIVLQRVDGLKVFPKGSLQLKDVAINAKPSAFIARPRVAWPMPCTNSQGQSSIGIRTYSWAT